MSAKKEKTENDVIRQVPVDPGAEAGRACRRSGQEKLKILPRLIETFVCVPTSMWIMFEGSRDVTL
jgi:hypothetical protein